jgi:hypothetical protein
LGATRVVFLFQLAEKWNKQDRDVDEEEGGFFKHPEYRRWIAD